MPIDELTKYWPKIKLPVYTKITDPRYNDFTVGDTYEMRIEDSQRVEEHGETGPYNYVHECILIAKEEKKIKDIHPLLLAFDVHTSSRQEALKRLSSDEQSWDDEREVEMLVLLRKDAVKEFVTSDMDVLEDADVTDEFTKEHAEE